MALGPMTNRRPSGGKVRIGSADFVGGPVRYRMVSVAPAFDPDAVSMSPVKGWTAAHDPAWGVFIPGSALVAARSDRDRAA
jgi:hypothetical protein